MVGPDTEGLIVRAGVFVTAFQNLTIGKNVSLNHNCFLLCEGGLYIGDNVSIAHGVSIVTTEHRYEDPSAPIKFQPITPGKVIISDNVWIGAKATILAGVSLAEGTIVAAGSVVKKSVTEENTVIGGIPARHIKHRFKVKGR
jgi:acetyltransferase-like isoleucine patch superfamily enzyme